MTPEWPPSENLNLELFRSNQQQDAHEFLNYLLNEIAEFMQKVQKKSQGTIQNFLGYFLLDTEERKTDEKTSNQGRKWPYSHFFLTFSKVGGTTFVHKIFEGILTNETRCLTCETVKNFLWIFIIKGIQGNVQGRIIFRS